MNTKITGEVIIMSDEEKKVNNKVNIDNYIEQVESSKNINDEIRDFFHDLVSDYKEKKRLRKEMNEKLNKVQRKSMDSFDTNSNLVNTQQNIKQMRELRLYIKQLSYDERSLLDQIKDLQKSVIDSPQTQQEILFKRDKIKIENRKLDIQENEQGETSFEIKGKGGQSLEKLMEFSNGLIDKLNSNDK